jgi:AraC-like DNA-binding protein
MEATSTVWECDGIRLGHHISRSGATWTAPSGPRPDVVRLHFGLRGNYSFTYRQLGKSFDLIGGHHNLMYSREFDIDVQLHSPEIETFGIQFPKERFIQLTRNASDALQRFAQEILEGKDVLFTQDWGALDPGIEGVIRQIIHSAYAGDLQNIFLLSKSIELLVLSADACSQVAQRQGEPFLKSRADKEKIIATRDLINERLDAPPNLCEVARLVGLNEYKLKRGFKETFRTTVFGYLAEQRLHLALQYLRDTNKTAAEIAMELGYATPQHFNNAFKKKFSLTPGRVRAAGAAGVGGAAGGAGKIR